MMKRGLIVTMLVIGAICISGCGRGGLRGWTRGAPCGMPQYGVPQTTGGACTCGAIPQIEVYDTGPFGPPESGIIPPPGPATNN